MTEQVFLAAGYLTTALGLLAAAAVLVFFVLGRRSGLSGRVTIGAAFASVLWLLAYWAAFAWPGLFGLLYELSTFLEVAAHVCWFGVLLQALGVSRHNLRWGPDPAKAQLLWLSAGVGAVGCGLAGFHVFLAWTGSAPTGPLTAPDLALNAVRLTIAILGLVLVEQVLRNTRRDNYWNVKYLVIGLAMLYGFAFVTYADAVLFQRIAPALVAVHGVVFALAAPFLILGMLRNRRQRLNVRLSRRLVFRTSVLAFTGIYLLLVGTGGFWLRLSGGDWGDFLAILFVLVALALGIGLVSSRSLRERVSVALARNLFQRKHDYGEQWQRITETLLADDDEANLPQRAVRALGEIVHAHRGALWRLGDSGVFLPAAQLHTGWDAPLATDTSRAVLEAFADDASPVLTVNNRRQDDPRDRLAALLGEIEGAYLAVPLPLVDRLYGLVVLTAPATGEAVEWEDEELLELAARQIASFLAQRDSQAALVRSRQLDAFNQMTAFVVHDLKTVVAQLSLMARNAEKHRDNPGFVDDMVRTTAHAVDRMQSLLSQLREQRSGTSASLENVPLRQVVERVLERQRVRSPRPELIECEVDLHVRANPDQLATVIGHLVQNAQEVSRDGGSVLVAVLSDEHWNVIRIEDDGPGMDPEFVARRLFRPFESTKGLAGMGIGTWQAREYVRLLGGDIRVESVVGRGSVFSVLLPPVDPPGAAQEASPGQAIPAQPERPADRPSPALVENRSTEGGVPG